MFRLTRYKGATGVMGNRAGALKVAAHRLGMTTVAYLSRVQSGEKWCHKCGQWKPAGEFWADRTRGDGRKAVCKKCDYTRRTPGPSKAQRREAIKGWFSWCRRCCEWRVSNQVHAGLCRLHANEYARRRYAEDPRFRMARRQHTYSRKRGVAPIPLEGQEVLLEEFDGKCAYCGDQATTWDHVTPVIGGGQTTPGNVVPACRHCNSSKGSGDVFEWLEKKGLMASDQLFDRIILAECGLWG